MLARTLLIASFLLCVTVSQGWAEPAAREWVDVTQYTCSSVEKRDQLVALFDAALIPALNRLGANKVGVFFTDTQTNDTVTNYNTSVFVISSFGCLCKLATVERGLLADEVFMKDASALFTAPMKDPLFVAQKRALFRTFEACPALLQPSTSPDRLLQLRIYNSYTLERNAKKVAMFEQGGEIALFRKCGMNPAFFAEAVAGDNLPNLTYLLAFDNKAAKDAAWNTFKAHPDWLKLKADPQYKDTANKITNIVLRPSKGSQL